MKKLLLLLTLFVFSAVSFSQSFWSRKALGVTDNLLLASLSYADQNVVWGHLRRNGPAPAGAPQIQKWARSVDGGNTWTTGNITIGNTALGIGNVHAISSQIAYAAAFVGPGGPGGGIWKTIDGGVTWTKQLTASFNSGTSFVNSVYFWDVDNGIALGDPDGYMEVYTTTNGGVNWTRVPESAGLTSVEDEYGIVDEFAVIGDTIWFSSTTGRLFKSVNKGVSWTAIQTPIGTFSSEVLDLTAKFAFADANNGIITTSAFEYFTTSNGGTTWTQIFPDTNIRNGKVCRVPGNPTAYVLGGDDPDNDPNSIAARGTSYSLDLGATWSNINIIPGELFGALDSALEFYDINTGICGDVRQDALIGGAFKYVGTYFDNLATNTFSNDKAFKASPNPTTGLVAISGKNITNVIVTDVLGKQISNTNYTSLNDVNVDMTNFNAGMYMVKVTNTDGNTSTIKVVRQ